VKFNRAKKNLNATTPDFSNISRTLRNTSSSNKCRLKRIHTCKVLKFQITDITFLHIAGTA